MKKKAWIAGALVLAIVILAAAAGIAYPMMRDSKAYRNADRLLQAGDYDGAIQSFEALAEKNYKDAAEKAAAGRAQREQKLSEDYSAACENLKAENYAQAKAAFEALGEYMDSKTQASYAEAFCFLEAEEFSKAQSAFAALNGFEASADYAAYAEARLMEEAGLYEEAGKIYMNNPLLKDSLDRYGALNAKILERDYITAVETFESGKYEEALALLSAQNLLNYRDSAGIRQECEFKIAENALLAKDYEAAEAGFTRLAENGYENAAEMVMEVRYQKGRMLAETGDYNQAYDVLSSIIEYSDVQAYIDNSKALSFIDKYAPGRKLTIGRFPVDQQYSDMEDIEWRILAADGNKRLLISEKCITTCMYNSQIGRVTWETSSVRNSFIKSFPFGFFTEEFRNVMIPVTNVNPDNPDYRTEGGNDTEDLMFLLSIDEVKKYFPEPADRVAYPMKHAVSNGILRGTDGSVWWWLRSPGNVKETAACVSYENGALSVFGQRVDERRFGVRPAMWIDIEAYDEAFG